MAKIPIRSFFYTFSIASICCHHIASGSFTYPLIVPHIEELSRKHSGVRLLYSAIA